MRRLPKLALISAFAVAVSLFPLPALSLGPPQTFAAGARLGLLRGVGPVIDPGFPIDYVGVSWTRGDEPALRFRSETGWTEWRTAHEDGLPPRDGRIGSGLLAGEDADAYQVRGHGRGVHALAINTTDGPRSLRWHPPVARAGPLAQPPLISRAEWGADESYRFNGNGSLKSTPSYYPTQKLIVHHTVTDNADPDPASTIRAIYYDHVMNRGFADIAYNFLIDAGGQIYKGRYSGAPGTTDADTPTGENASGEGVTGAHTGGYNSGTMGIALLGNFVSQPPTPEARSALVEHLAWEADHHALNAQASTMYVNPQTGDSKTAYNVSGHRDWGSTACPGGVLHADLPAIRSEVAAKVGRVDGRPPRIKRVEHEARRLAAIILWETNEPADGQIRYRAKGGKWRESEPKPRAVEDHRFRLGGLRRERIYWFRILSKDGSGNLSRSRRFTFGTG